MSDTLANTSNADISNNSTSKKPTHLVARSLGGFLGLFQVLGLASLAARNGLNWHGYLLDLVHWYRGVLLPLHDYVLRPLLRPVSDLFHFQLTPFTLDVVTLMIIMFGAANTEAVVQIREAADNVDVQFDL